VTGQAGCTLNAVVLGASGGLGRAIWGALRNDPRYGRVLAVSRTAPSDPDRDWIEADATNATDLDRAARRAADEVARLHLLVNCVGTLQDGGRLTPEKSLRDLGLSTLERLVAVNAFAPLAALSAFAPLLRHGERAVAAILSAMVGSITDNHLGGWYAYRMSKAALNMGLKCAAIELRRSDRGPIVVAVHPGTTATPLSAPFLKHHPHRQPDESAAHILRVLHDLEPADSGRFFNWDGSELAW
jgi:NAD(P)-dependent dehydrogenase (short-subunit alcohol dehydrogenase family)